LFFWGLPLLRLGHRYEAWCQYNYHKVDVNGNPVVGAEFTYDQGTILLGRISAWDTLDELFADSAEATTLTATLTQAKADAVSDPSFADETQAVTDAQAAYDAVKSQGFAASYAKQQALLTAKQNLTAAIKAVPAVVAAQTAYDNSNFAVKSALYGATAGPASGKVYTTDKNGDFHMVRWCGSSGTTGTVWPSLTETKAPAGLDLAGDVFGTNPNVTITLGAPDRVTGGLLTYVHEVTIVDQPASAKTESLVEHAAAQIPTVTSAHR
jgi:hypothetical protein